jgi:uncharacterized protein with GYD domain
MAKYLVKAHYTSDGAKGLLKEGGSARRDAVAKMAKQIGGSLESFYYAFGETDAYVVVDLPNPEAAAALGLAVSASGAVSLSTVVLLTPEQIDAARDVSIDYRPPGG